MDTMMKDGKVEYADMDSVRESVKNDPNAVMYDAPDPDKEMDVDAIPNIEKLTEDILEFLDFKDLPENVELAQTKYGVALDKMYSKFPNINYKIINVLMDTEASAEDKEKDLMDLLSMLERLDKIKQGKLNIKSEFESFREEMHEEYVYPQFGGKAAYERTINCEENITRPKRRRKRSKKTFKRN
jgi:hypothetical protein